MKKINENTKVTLTVSQLRKLVKESKASTKNMSTEELATSIRRECLKCLDKVPADGSPNALYEPGTGLRDIILNIYDMVDPFATW